MSSSLHRPKWCFEFGDSVASDWDRRFDGSSLEQLNKFFPYSFLLTIVGVERQIENGKRDILFKRTYLKAGVLLETTFP